MPKHTMAKHTMAKHYTRRIQRTRSSKHTRKQTGGKGGRIKRAVNFYLDGTSSLTSADIPTFIQETFGTYLMKNNITPDEFREIQSRVFNKITKRIEGVNKNIHTPVKALTKLQQLNDVSRLLNMMEPPKQQIFKNFTNSPPNSAELKNYMNRQRGQQQYGETNFKTPPINNTPPIIYKRKIHSPHEQDNPPRPVLHLEPPHPRRYGKGPLLFDKFTPSPDAPAKKKKSLLELEGRHTLIPERI
jgi:hypothetical protein